MATKIYLSSAAYTGTVAIPTPSGIWTASGSAVTNNCSFTKASSTITTVTSSTATNTGHYLLGQFISPPLGAQTISGLATGISGQLRGSISNTAAVASADINVRVFTSSGTQRGILFIQTSGDSAYTATITNRKTPVGPATLTAVTASVGDVLVFEIGSARNVSSANRTFSHSYGDNNANDLAIEETGTSALNPWVQFRQTLNWATSGNQTSIGRIRVTDTLTQTGIARLRITNTDTQAGLARLKNTSSFTQLSLSRLKNTTTNIQTGLTRLRISDSFSITGLSRVLFSNSRVIFQLLGRLPE